MCTSPPGPVSKQGKQQAGRGFVLPPPDTDLVFLREGTSSPVQVPGPAAGSSEAPLQVRSSSCSSQLNPAPGYGAETESAIILPYAGGPVLCFQLGYGLTPGEAREGGCCGGVDGGHNLPAFFHGTAWLL